MALHVFQLLSAHYWSLVVRVFEVDILYIPITPRGRCGWAPLAHDSQVHNHVSARRRSDLASPSTLLEAHHATSRTRPHGTQIAYL